MGPQMQEEKMERVTLLFSKADQTIPNKEWKIPECITKSVGGWK